MPGQNPQKESPIFGFDDELEPVGRAALRRLLSRDAVNHLDRTKSAPAALQPAGGHRPAWPATPRRSERSHRPPQRLGFELLTPEALLLSPGRDRQKRLSEAWITREDYPSVEASPFAGEWDPRSDIGAHLHRDEDDQLNATVRTNYGSLFSPPEVFYPNSVLNPPELSSARRQNRRSERFSLGSPLAPRYNVNGQLDFSFSPREGAVQPIRRITSIPEQPEDLLPDLLTPPPPPPHLPETVENVLKKLFIPDKNNQLLGELFRRVIDNAKPLALEWHGASTPSLSPLPPPLGGPPSTPIPEPEITALNSPPRRDIFIDVHTLVEDFYNYTQLVQHLGPGPEVEPTPPRQTYNSPPPSRFEELNNSDEEFLDQIQYDLSGDESDPQLDLVWPLLSPPPPPPTSMALPAADIRLYRIRINAASECNESELSRYDFLRVPRSFLRRTLAEAVKHKENLAECVSVLQEEPGQAAIVARAKKTKADMIEFIALATDLLCDHSDPEETSSRPSSAQSTPTSSTRVAFKKKKVEENEASTLANIDAIVGELESLSITTPTSDQGYRVVAERLATLTKRTESIVKDSSALTNDALDADLPDQAESIDQGVRKLKQTLVDAETKVHDVKVQMGVFGDSNAKLSELKPPAFSGDNVGADFFTFQKEYWEYSATKPATHAQQLRILLKTCLSGPAAALCSELTSVDEVLRHLKTHYGNARVLLSTRIADFKSIGSCPTGTAAKKRTWLITANQKLKSIRKLAGDHGLEQNLYFSNILSEVRAALPYKLEEKFKERLEDTNTDCTDHEEMFSVLVEFFDSLMERSSFEVQYELALGPRQAKGDDRKETKKPEKPADRYQPRTQTKKSFAMINVSSSESESDGSCISHAKNHKTSKMKKKIHATSRPDGLTKGKGHVTSKSSSYKEPTEEHCPICKLKHKYLFQCEKFQKTLVKERVRLTKTTKACFRCLRLDSQVNMAEKDKWWEEHKDHCENEWVCVEADCKQNRPNRQWHMTMCMRHSKANKNREKDFLKNHKALLKPSATMFFLQHRVYNLDPVPVQHRPEHAAGALVHDDIYEPSIFMLQKVVVPNNEKILLFYDSGCSGSALNDRACAILPIRQITQGPTKVGVAGGRVVEVPGGDVQFWLELNKPNEQATLTGLNMPKVTTAFPDWNLQAAYEDLQKGYRQMLPNGPALPAPPAHLGGVEVDIMMGIRYLKYFPEKKFSLPCGLAIFEGQFKSPDGLSGILGGTHKSWRNARDSVQLLTREIFLTHEFRAYRVSENTLRHVYQEIQHQDDEAEVVDLLTYLPPLKDSSSSMEESSSDQENISDCNNNAFAKFFSSSGEEKNCIFPSSESKSKTKNQSLKVEFELTREGHRLLERYKPPPEIEVKLTRRGQSIFNLYKPPQPLLAETSEHLSCPFKHCNQHNSDNWKVPEYWDLLPNLLTVKQDLEKYENLDTMGSEVTYRCLRCRNCNDCRKGDLIEQGSLEGEIQQALIERCVKLNIEKKRLEATLPFIMDPNKNLAPNKGRAMMMLRSQLAKIKRKPSIKEDVLKAHNKLLDNGHVAAIRDLSPNLQDIMKEAGAMVIHIPWNIVTNPNSFSTPARMTFNGSSKTSTGHSLNSTLAKGENKLPKIFHILLKFGAKKHGFTADVAMAYNSLKLDPLFWNFQRYLWCPSLEMEGEVVEYVITTIIYGIICSGNLTAAGFGLLADHLREHFPHLVKGAEALENTYVDDTAHAEDTEEECRAVVAAMDFALGLASMKVKAYTFSGTKPDEKVSPDGETVGLLGYKWWPYEDLVQIAVKELFFGKVDRGRLPEAVSGDIATALSKNFTRRTLVAKVASVFDPLGYATPITSRIKLDLSAITDLKTLWDQPLPESYIGQWVSNLEDLQELRSIQFKRCFIDPNAVSNEVELIVQVDASEKIACAIVHARTLLPDGSFSCRLVAAKSKLVHMSTVPRGELKGAVLGASLAHIIKRNLGAQVKRTLFITDSTIVIYWLNQDQRPLQTAVRNGVIEIRRLSHPEQWFHIDTKNNLADLGTRDALVSDIKLDSEWQKGTWWMTLPLDRMPIMSKDDITLNQQERQEANREVKAADICGICLPELKDKVAERYAFSKYVVDPCVFPWSKSVRTLAFVMRFIAKLKLAVKNKRPKIAPEPLEQGTVPVESSDPPSTGYGRPAKKTGRQGATGSDSPPSPPSPPRTRSRTRREADKSVKTLYKPASFQGYGGSFEEKIKEAPPRDPPPPPREDSPPRVRRNLNKVSLFMDDEGNMVFPHGYVSAKVPDIDESKGLKPPPQGDVPPCTECTYDEPPPVQERFRVHLQPQFPANTSAPAPPPAPTLAPTVASATTESCLRPDAPEFHPTSKCCFPNLSSNNKDMLRDFQLSPEEIKDAELYFFKKATLEVKQFSKPAEYKKQTFFKDGVLYYSGRILDGSSVYDPEQTMSDLEPMKFVRPVCDRYSPVSYAIMIHSHSKLTHHRNTITTLRESRNLAFVLKGRDLSNEIREHCTFCKRFKARLIEVEMGKMHESRMTCAPAFFCAQVDLFGKYYAYCEHNHRSSVPVWGVIFKDPSSGAIAIYGMPGYSTGAFINCYLRHACRYGHPLKLFIDAGSQLMKACKDLEFSWTDLTTTLNSQFGVGVEHVVCTTGSHAAHGVVERSVLEVKRLLNVTYRTLRMDLYGYDTAFTFIANELNSLPLCLGSRYENLEHSDLITPSRLLLGRNNQRAPTGYPRIASKSRQISQLDAVYKAWWQTWKAEKLVDYIPAPSKWHKNSRPPVIGDIVVFIRDEAVLGESLWKLGTIEELIPSKADGKIRAVMIEYKNPSEEKFRLTKRDVRKVAILYREGELELMEILNEASKTDDIRATVQLKHHTVHSVLLQEFLNSLHNQSTEVPTDVRGIPESGDIVPLQQQD